MNPTSNRILVVDDNPMNAQLVRIVLGRAGCAVSVVDNAPDALEFLGSNEVDVLVSDVSMPGMSGKDLCREVRARLGDRRPRLVAYTAFAMAHQRDEIMSAGFDALLVKPALPATILAAVQGEPS